jgi:hypothetical protein
MFLHLPLLLLLWILKTTGVAPINCHQFPYRLILMMLRRGSTEGPDMHTDRIHGADMAIHSDPIPELADADGWL